MAALLLIVGDAASPDADDADLKALFEGSGHTVTYVSDETAEVSWPAHDAVAVAGSTNNATYGSKGLNSAKGICLLDTTGVVALNLSDSVASVGTGTTFDILLPAHPAAGGLSGTVTIHSPADTIFSADGNLGTGATVVAEQTGFTGRKTIVAYDAGALLVGGGAAAGRRILCGVLDPASAEADADTLILAAVAWAAGLAAPAGVSIAANGDLSWTAAETVRIKIYGEKDASGVEEVLGVIDHDQTQPYPLLSQLLPGAWVIWLTHFTGDPEAPTAESPKSNTDSVTIGAAPSAPSLSASINAGGNPALLVGGATNATTIRIDRSPAGAGTWTEIHDFGDPDGGSFEDTSAADATAYDYRAVAEGTGETASTTASITTPPAAPTTGAFVATSFHGGTVTHNAGAVDVRCTLDGSDAAQYVFVIDSAASLPLAVPFVLEPSVTYTPTLRSIGADGDSAALVGTADSTDASPAAGAILVRVADPANPTAGDSALAALIDGSSTFTAVAVAGDQIPFPVLATYDAAVIAPSSGSAGVAEDLNHAGVGVLVMRYGIEMDLFSAGGANAASVDSIDIVDDTHELAAGYPAGALVILSTAQDVSGVADANLPAGADGMARRGGSATHWTLVGYEAGALNENGHIAEARRALWFLSDAALGALDPDGDDITVQALDWLVPAPALVAVGTQMSSRPLSRMR